MNKAMYITILLFQQWMYSNKFQNKIINPTGSLTDGDHTNMEHLLLIRGTWF